MTTEFTRLQLYTKTHRKQTESFLKNNKNTLFNFKHVFNKSVSTLPYLRQKFKIEDLFLDDQVCKLEMKSETRKKVRDLIIDSTNNLSNEKPFYYSSKNEIDSVKHFMRKRVYYKGLLQTRNEFKNE